MSNPPHNDPPNQLTKGRQKPTTVTREIQFSGPLPPPSVLEGYERILSGSMDRLFTLVEADAKHQRDIEQAALDAEITGFRRGQVFGFIVVLVTLSVAAFCAYFGHEWPAAISGGTTVVGLASAFILGRKTDAPKEQIQRKR